MEVEVWQLVEVTVNFRRLPTGGDGVVGELVPALEEVEVVGKPAVLPIPWIPLALPVPFRGLVEAMDLQFCGSLRPSSADWSPEFRASRDRW